MWPEALSETRGVKKGRVVFDPPEELDLRGAPGSVDPDAGESRRRRDGVDRRIAADKGREGGYAL